jgi:hypothetical protein
MEYNWSKLEKENQDRWNNLCPTNEYRLVSRDVISGLLSDSLVRKYDSVLLVCSGVADSTARVYMANGYRVDQKDSAIDQMPYGFILTGGTGIPSGLLIQHGNWESRRIEPPVEFWSHIERSGVGTCYPLESLPAQNSGTIADLQVAKHVTDSFQALLAGLRSQFKESKI